MDGDIPTRDRPNDETDQERLRVQKELQMLDLGTARREYVTTVDKPLPRDLRLSKAELLRSRIVNEEGTDASKWYRENKEAINAWHNIGDTIAEDVADREQLQDIMGGQSHRARLNKDIQEQGGQAYGERSAMNTEIGPRQGKVAGFDRRGSARSGRGAPTHVPVGKDFPHPSFVSRPPSTRPSSATHRPLDPAVDPNREYGYKTRRGGKTLIVPYGGGTQPPVGSASTRNDRSEHSRRAMVGSTVRTGPTSSSKPKSDKSPHPVMTRPARPDPQGVVINDQAFLEALRETKTTTEFHEQLADRPKPAPASRAAGLIRQSVKTLAQANDTTKKSGQPQTWSTGGFHERHQEQCQMLANPLKMGAGTVDETSSRQVASLPPINWTVIQDNKPSSGASWSAVDSTLSQIQALGAAASKKGAYLDDVSSRTRPEQDRSSAEAGLQSRSDLIMFNDSSDPFQTSEQVMGDNSQTGTVANSTQSSSTPDLMDQELNGEISQASLTPTRTTPRWIVYRGVRYIRADQATSRVAGRGSQERSTTPHKVTPEKVVHDAKGDITSQTPQGSEPNNRVLGYHHLPSKSTTTSPTRSGSPSAVANARLGTRLEVWDLEKQQQNKGLPASSQSDIAMANATGADVSLRGRATAAGLEASKYASPNARLGASTTQREPSSEIEAAGRNDPVGQIRNGTPSLRNASGEGQDNRAAETLTDKQSCSVSESADGPGAKPPHREKEEAQTAPDIFRKGANLTASKWGSADAEVITLAMQEKAPAAADITSSIDFGEGAEEAKALRQGVHGSGTYQQAVGSAPASVVSTTPDPRALTFVPKLTERCGNIPKTHNSAPSIDRSVTPTDSLAKSSPQPARSGPPSGAKPVELSSCKSPGRETVAVASSASEDQLNAWKLSQGKTGLAASKYAVVDESGSTADSTTSKRSTVTSKPTTNLPVVSRRGRALNMLKGKSARIDSDSESGDI